MPVCPESTGLLHTQTLSTAIMPGECVIESLKGNEIEQDKGCNAMSVWQSYNSATSRIPELAGKSTPGHFVTICGEGGTPPLEEYQGDLDVNNEKDYSVLIAGHDDFFADRLLGRNPWNGWS